MREYADCCEKTWAWAELQPIPNDCPKIFFQPKIAKEGRAVSNRRLETVEAFVAAQAKLDKAARQSGQLDRDDIRQGTRFLKKPCALRYTVLGPNFLRGFCRAGFEMIAKRS